MSKKKTIPMNSILSQLGGLQISAVSSSMLSYLNSPPKLIRLKGSKLRPQKPNVSSHVQAELRTIVYSLMFDSSTIFECHETSRKQFTLIVSTCVSWSCDGTLSGFEVGEVMICRENSDGKIPFSIV